MADEAVREVQTWLNSTYGALDGWVHIDEDGYTGGGTVAGLIRGLQHELNTSMDGIFGVGTMNLFNSMFPNGLSIQTQNQNSNINYIINGGFFCRGIDPGSFSGVFTEGTKTAVQTLQEQIGLSSQNGVVNSKILRAILTTDAFTLISAGDANIRTIQRNLNNQYGTYFEKYITTNGVYERQTNTALIIALQVVIGVTPDGIWGNNTMNNCPTLMIGSTNASAIYILQYALYCNGYNPNGFDGGFGNGVKNAVAAFQAFCMLDADGICGKQTWASLMVSCGDRNRTVNACDTRFEITTDRAKILKNNGYQIVGRYLTGGDFKELRNGEAERIIQEGLFLFPIFQENGRQTSDFSYSRGQTDALNALNAAREKGMPAGTIIYFAVDFDAVDVEVTNYVIPYFEAIVDYMRNSEYRIGVYGARNVCRRVSEISSSIVSSFVSDMSTGYSGNIGYKLPQNWNYDQINNVTISDPIYGSLEIDKDVYSQTENAVNKITPNGRVYNKLVELYNLAIQRNHSENILQANRCVLDYLRGSYVGGFWDWAGGKPDSTYIDMVNNTYPEYTLNDFTTLCNNIDIMIDHFAYSAKVTVNPAFSAVAEVLDYCSWAGDLAQMAGRVQTVYNNTGHLFTEDEIYNLIGCNDDAYAQSLGFDNAGDTKFNIVDLYQDLDAYVFASVLSTKKIYEIYRDYYLKEQCTDENRANEFYNFLNKDGYTGTKYNIIKNIAQYYMNKPPIFGEMFESKFGYYDETLWATKFANAFARKITDMMGE